jgi:hypothetical protein
MFAIPAIIGFLGSFLPSILSFFEKKQSNEHELNLRKLDIEIAREKAKGDLAIENVKADVAEGESLRRHDSSLSGGEFFDTLRASVRPTVTYVFFLLFIVIKFSAAYVMIKNGDSVPEMLKSVWDPETASLFATIMAFWFGSRVFERRMPFKGGGPRP